MQRGDCVVVAGALEGVVGAAGGGMVSVWVVRLDGLFCSRVAISPRGYVHTVAELCCACIHVYSQLIVITSYPAVRTEFGVFGGMEAGHVSPADASRRGFCLDA